MKPIRLFKAGLEPLTSILRKADFRGWLGALVQFNDKQVRVERILTDACLFTQFLDGIHDIAKPIMALATGGSELGFVPRWYGTLLLANAGQALAVGGLWEGNMKHLLLHGVVQTEHGYFATEHGSLGYATAWGLTASEVHRRLYRTAKTVRLAGMVYRTDIKSQGAFHKMLSHDWL